MLILIINLSILHDIMLLWLHLLLQSLVHNLLMPHSKILVMLRSSMFIVFSICSCFLNAPSFSLEELNLVRLWHVESNLESYRYIFVDSALKISQDVFLAVLDRR